MRLWSVPGIDADLEAATALLSLSRIGRLPAPERACLYEPPNSAGCSGRVRVEGNHSSSGGSNAGSRRNRSAPASGTKCGSAAEARGDVATRAVSIREMQRSAHQRLSGRAGDASATAPSNARTAEAGTGCRIGITFARDGYVGPG